MPTENEKRPCTYPRCKGTLIFMIEAPIPNPQFWKVSESRNIWPIKKQPGWICDKNREHFELTTRPQPRPQPIVVRSGSKSPF